MYNNDYEEYMRSVLGYPVHTYNAYENTSQYFPYRYDNMNFNDSRKYDELYPEIYGILKPMIKKICGSSNNMNLTNESLEIMANEIYTNIEQDINVVNVNINTSPEAERTGNSTRKDFKVSQSVNEKDNSRKDCCRNTSLRDLIKILIIQQFLENNQNRPPRPGPRPPFPPRPPYRELESPAIYSNDYNANQSFSYYNQF